MLSAWALIVCEKKQNVLFEIRQSMGTCFTPKMQEASEMSSWILAPTLAYAAMG